MTAVATLKVGTAVLVKGTVQCESTPGFEARPVAAHGRAGIVGRVVCAYDGGPMTMNSSMMSSEALYPP
jgi:hypothetical protein